MKLIDADALKEAMKKAKTGHYTAFSDSTLNCIYRVIDNAPVIIWCDKTSEGLPLMDLRQIPKGEWIEIPVDRDILHPDGRKWECSACHSSNCYGKPPFCMECGAKMKNGRGNNDIR